MTIDFDRLIKLKKKILLLTKLEYGFSMIAGVFKKQLTFHVNIQKIVGQSAINKILQH